MDTGWIILIILAIIYGIGVIRSLRNKHISDKFKRRRLIFSYVTSGIALIILLVLQIMHIFSK